ncbi:MAG TPA: SH3 domain-containing protein, partial [Roseiflexaceae bacterium]|nr:SH3 domain-containing protein [Roseiflexaceae bacterium]
AAPPTPPRPHPRGADHSRRRSLTGLGIVIALFAAVACGAYYLSSTAAGQALEGGPSIALPDWLTGVVGGQGQVLVVTIGDIEGLNLRDAPGLGSQVIGLLPNGARVRQIGGPRTVDDVPWLQVRAEIDGQVVEGWVSAHFVRPE